MKKRVPEEPLLNTLARQVGHAAGTIAKTAQNLASDAAAIVQTGAVKPAKTRTKAARKKTTKRSAVPKQKKKTTKAVTRKSRTRARKSSTR